MTLSHRAAIQLILFAGTATLVVAAPQSRFFDLGPPGGAFPSGFDALSADGGDLNYFGSTQTVWRHESGSAPFTIPGVASSSWMSEDGRTFATTVDQSVAGMPAFRPAIWSELAGLQVLATHPPGTLDQGWVRDVNHDGNAVVGAYTLQGNPNTWTSYEEAFLWLPGGSVQLLGELPGDDHSSRAIAVNDDGTVVVGTSVTDHTWTPNGHWPIRQPFVWTPQTGIQQMPSAPWRFEPHDISADGRFAVGTGIFWDISGSEAPYATRVEVGVGETVIYQDIGSEAVSVSADGRVVVGRVAIAGAGSEVFVWVEGQGAQLLETVLLANGATGVTGWRLYRAFGVSHDGNAIAGLGTDPQGQTRVFVAYLDGLPSGLGSTGCTATAANSTGGVGELRALGFGYVGGGGMQLTAEALPAGSTTLFLCSMTQGFAAMPGGSQGTLCLDGSIGRFAASSEIQMADTAGRASLDVDLTFLPQPGGRVSVQPGQTWIFQAWHRDANPGPTSNFTGSIVELFE